MNQMGTQCELQKDLRRDGCLSTPQQSCSGFYLSLQAHKYLKESSPNL